MSARFVRDLVVRCRLEGGGQADFGSKESFSLFFFDGMLKYWWLEIVSQDLSLRVSSNFHVQERDGDGEVACRLPVCYHLAHDYCHFQIYANYPTSQPADGNPCCPFFLSRVRVSKVCLACQIYDIACGCGAYLSAKPSGLRPTLDGAKPLHVKVAGLMSQQIRGQNARWSTNYILGRTFTTCNKNQFYWTLDCFESFVYLPPSYFVWPAKQKCVPIMLVLSSIPFETLSSQGSPPSI